MGRKKKVDKEIKIDCKELQTMQENYVTEIETNPEFSLDVDPLGKYNLNQVQKNFIKYYIQFKNVATAAELCGIDVDTAKTYFLNYTTQQEIRRINRALYHKQFEHKILDLDDIGGYLSSLITDENIPIHDQLKTKDKLQVVTMLIDLIRLKKESFEDPNKLRNIDVASQLKNLSLITIQQLLVQSNKQEKKEPIILDNNLSAEEKEYLNSLPTESLLKLLNYENEKKEK